MPAIQLARLKIQVTELLTYFTQPADFLRELHTMLDFYADRTRRSGQSGKPKPLIQAYNVPRQVMRRIESDITPLVDADPDSALILADRLWLDAWYESRILAIAILGMLPPEPIGVIIDRLQAWGKGCRDDALLASLLDKGAAPVRSGYPNEYFVMVENWLSSGDVLSRKVGLRAMPALIQNPDFENLPALYRLLAPQVRESTSALEADLIQVVRSLGRRSPQETAYFLQQNLKAPHKSGLGLITRKSLDVFPPDLEESLRKALRERMRASNGG
jgi:hypothetical protein